MSSRTSKPRTKKLQIKYREAVATSSPGLPLRLPWVSNSNGLNPDGVAPFFTHATQRSRRAATLGWRSQPLRGIRSISHQSQPKTFLDLIRHVKPFGHAHPLFLSANGFGLTTAPGLTFCVPSATTVSPCFNPSSITHIVPARSPTLTLRISILLSRPMTATW